MAARSALTSFRISRVEIKEYIDAGSTWSSPVRICGHAPDTDAEVVGEEVFLNSMRDGKIVEVRGYKNAGRSPRSRGPVGARRSRRLLSLRDTARAMSQENVEIARRAYRRHGDRGDREAVLELS